MKRDFLKLTDLTLDEHRWVFERARALKALRAEGRSATTLAGKSLLCLFEKPSTRTRLSFEAAMQQLGGSATTLQAAESQIARGEPLSDTARVAGSYYDAIMFRTFGDDRLAELARHSRAPVINGLSDGGHPVQLLADLMTVRERCGELSGKVIAWVGDAASNMALSWIEAARLFGFKLQIAAPVGYRPPRELQAASKDIVSLSGEPKDAVRGAHVVNTDVWTSMGQEKEMAARRAAFSGYCVDEALLALARPDAIVLHCLPAHRGEEISAAVLEGSQSAVWDEAENRMHAQKSLLELLILGDKRPQVSSAT
jgi:ornithine carbamoyltransferase